MSSNDLSPITYNLPFVGSNKINTHAVNLVKEHLPILDQKTRAFDRSNSQTSLSMMSLTMLNGQSPFRLARQILAEVENRKLALAEAQCSHAKMLEEIELLRDKDRTHVEDAELNLKICNIDSLENKINGAFKDIATLVTAYKNLTDNYSMGDWDEEDFENEEMRFHVRRGFELMYRNLIESEHAHTSTIEYLQQFGIHPQVCLLEVAGYIKYSDDRIIGGAMLHANDLEEFLDAMAEKYSNNPRITSARIFGKENILNTDIMNKGEQ